MKPYERRAAGRYPYFKLAVWDARALTWRDGAQAFDLEAAARNLAWKKGPGRYRISTIKETGERSDGQPFDIAR